MMDSLPENFPLLHQGEEFIRGKSVEAIEAHDMLPHHFAAIEQTMTLFDHFSRGYANETEDQLVVQLLGIRLFNSAAAAVQLMLSGYYQPAVLQLRDLLEVGFLIDFFLIDRSQIAVWKACDEGQRNKQFSAVRIRIALDSRDGFTEKKREEHYKLLCSLGGHASMQGFRMVRPAGDGLAHCGPFFAEETLQQSAAEMAKIAINAALAFNRFFEPRNRLDALTKCNFQDAQADWMGRFFGLVPNRASLARMRALAEQMPEGHAA